MAQGGAQDAGQLVAGKIQPFLPADSSFSDSGVAGLKRAMTHPSVPGELNMDVPATYGDAHVKSHLAAIFQKRYPDVQTSGEVSKSLQAAVDNRAMAFILRNILKIDPSTIKVGVDYKNADKQRSIKRQGTAFEAIVAVVNAELGHPACEVFVEKVYDAYLETQETDLAGLRRADPKSSFLQKVAQYKLGAATNWVVPSIVPDPEGGKFTGKIVVKEVPERFEKGPLSGSNKNEVERELYAELDADDDLARYLEENWERELPKKRKAAMEAGTASKKADGDGAEGGGAGKRKIV